MIKQTHTFGRRPKKESQSHEKNMAERLGASMQSSFSIQVKDIKNEHNDTQQKDN